MGHMALTDGASAQETKFNSRRKFAKKLKIRMGHPVLVCPKLTSYEKPRH